MHLKCLQSHVPIVAVGSIAFLVLLVHHASLLVLDANVAAKTVSFTEFLDAPFVNSYFLESFKTFLVAITVLSCFIEQLCLEDRMG
ncbi:hypothetical protein Lal_00020959 [Lupinus albus]|nr:hypothetical protein Lal_00020959 [Lupinus albus]